MTTLLRERPILFSGAMVRAILDGRKTQTRRVAKWVPREAGLNLDAASLAVGHYFTGQPSSGFVLRSRGAGGCWNDRTHPLHCPYGVPGDRLWVRETFALECDLEYVGESEFEDWRDGRPFQTHTSDDPDYDGVKEWHTIPRYRATEPDTLLVIDDEAEFDYDAMRWTPSIFMPRWASRITLEITDVRVQRLQDISDADAFSEGIQQAVNEGQRDDGTAQGAFQSLWDSINAKREGGRKMHDKEHWEARKDYSWAANPWVWVLTFRRLP
jgi:hypothetical protein